MIMSRLILVFVVLFFTTLSAASQNNSAVSLSYQHLAQDGNHGIGAGFRTNIWKRVMILTDVSYFFKKYKGVDKDAFQAESYTRYAGLNVNLSYPLFFNEQFNLLPYAGIGLFYRNINGYMSSEGQNIQGGYPGMGAPFNVSTDDQFIAPLANIGVLLEFYLDDTFFIVPGVKSQMDVYDGTLSFFPYLSLGVGYRF